MVKGKKNLEIALYLKERWHDPTKETPKREIGECTETDSEKLAKRFWLRSKLYNEYGALYKEEMEKAFYWIYNAPLKDWEKMLESLTLSYEHEIHENNGLHLKKAKELFAFLS